MSFFHIMMIPTTRIAKLTVFQRNSILKIEAACSPPCPPSVEASAVVAMSGRSMIRKAASFLSSIFSAMDLDMDEVSSLRVESAEALLFAISPCILPSSLPAASRAASIVSFSFSSASALSLFLASVPFIAASLSFFS